MVWKKPFLAEVNLFKDNLLSFYNPTNTNNETYYTRDMSERLIIVLQDQVLFLPGELKGKGAVINSLLYYGRTSLIISTIISK